MTDGRDAGVAYEAPGAADGNARRGYRRLRQMGQERDGIAKTTGLRELAGARERVDFQPHCPPTPPACARAQQWWSTGRRRLVPSHRIRFRRDSRKPEINARSANFAGSGALGGRAMKGPVLARHQFFKVASALRLRKFPHRRLGRERSSPGVWRTAQQHHRNDAQLLLRKLQGAEFGVAEAVFCTL